MFRITTTPFFRLSIQKIKLGAILLVGIALFSSLQPALATKKHAKTHHANMAHKIKHSKAKLHVKSHHRPAHKTINHRPKHHAQLRLNKPATSEPPRIQT